MAANKIVRFGPIALSATLTTNLMNPPTLAGGVNVPGAACYVVIRHLRVTNRDAAGESFSFWIGGTGANTAGTEFMGGAKSVGAHDSYDWYGLLRLDAADFLVGGAGSAGKLSLQGEMEIGVA